VVLDVLELLEVVSPPTGWLYGVVVEVELLEEVVPPMGPTP
jgi:hypothetical protein